MEAEPECAGHIDLIDGRGPDCQPRLGETLAVILNARSPMACAKSPGRPMRLVLRKVHLPHKYTHLPCTTTPSKKACSAVMLRAFSHGCVRPRIRLIFGPIHFWAAQTI